MIGLIFAILSVSITIILGLYLFAVYATEVTKPSYLIGGGIVYSLALLLQIMHLVIMYRGN